MRPSFADNTDNIKPSVISVIYSSKFMYHDNPSGWCLFYIWSGQLQVICLFRTGRRQIHNPSLCLFARLFRFFFCHIRLVLVACIRSSACSKTHFLYLVSIVSFLCVLSSSIAPMISLCWPSRCLIATSLHCICSISVHHLTAPPFHAMAPPQVCLFPTSYHGFSSRDAAFLLRLAPSARLSSPRCVSSGLRRFPALLNCVAFRVPPLHACPDRRPRRAPGWPAPGCCSRSDRTAARPTPAAAAAAARGPPDGRCSSGWPPGDSWAPPQSTPVRIRPLSWCGVIPYEVNGIGGFGNIFVKHMCTYAQGQCSCAAFYKQGAEENNIPKVGGLENETK